MPSTTATGGADGAAPAPDDPPGGARRRRRVRLEHRRADRRPTPDTADAAAAMPTSDAVILLPSDQAKLDDGPVGAVHALRLGRHAERAARARVDPHRVRAPSKSEEPLHGYEVRVAHRADRRRRQLHSRGRPAKTATDDAEGAVSLMLPVDARPGELVEGEIGDLIAQTHYYVGRARGRSPQSPRADQRGADHDAQAHVRDGDRRASSPPRRTARRSRARSACCAACAIDTCRRTRSAARSCARTTSAVPRSPTRAARARAAARRGARAARRRSCALAQLARPRSELQRLSPASARCASTALHEAEHALAVAARSCWRVRIVRARRHARSTAALRRSAAPAPAAAPQREQRRAPRSAPRRSQAARGAAAAGR